MQTFAIITTDANPAVASIHDRMPVIVRPEDEEAWLHGDPAQALAILKPHGGEMKLRAVNRAMGSPNLEGPECLADAGPGWGEQQELL